MNKAELNEKWNEYCDVTKLVDDVMNLLTKYHHANTEHGVCTLLDTYFTNKKPLIDMFKTSSHYVGDMRIVVDIEMERGINANEVRYFCDRFVHDVDAKSAIYKYHDEDGKTICDYMETGIKSFKATDLLEGEILTAFNNLKAKKGRFGVNGVTFASEAEFIMVEDAIRQFRCNARSTLRGEIASHFKASGIKGSYTEGMKTSRAFNRLCMQYNIHTLPEYNRLFARYSDMVSGLKRKMKFFISLNPLDYLTMSFGNSWASCHTIDKRNERHMPNDYSGAYCAGTVSYMLDGASIITYVHDSMPTSVEDGKIYRNMFHYNNGTLVQGRIYPQGNDGATDLYKEFGRIVQIELGTMIGLSNTTWTKKSGGCGNNVASYGAHYRDYYYQSDCNVSYPNEMPAARENVVHVGRNTICVRCGRMMSDDRTGSLSHSNCNN